MRPTAVLAVSEMDGGEAVVTLHGGPSIHASEADRLRSLPARPGLICDSPPRRHLSRNTRIASISPGDERMPHKITIEDLYAVAAERGGKCLSTEYLGAHAAHDWECAKGHQWTASWNNIQKGSWCPTCARLPEDDPRDAWELARDRGGECLGQVTLRTGKAGYRWRCEHGHEWEQRISNIRSGNWCATCARESR